MEGDHSLGPAGGRPGGTSAQRDSRQGKVRDKRAAAVQTTAEQLIRESYEHREVPSKPPRQEIADEDELKEYQSRKRTAFENNIRRSRQTVSNYTKYAKWEQNQGELERARSIYERAIQSIPNSPQVYINYTEFEMVHSNVNLARNIFDRAVTHLPREDSLWYKYVYMEQKLGSIPNAREVFERWMEWQPDEAAWNSYINMEQSYREYDRVRAIYQKFVKAHPQAQTWIQWAKFEETIQRSVKRARQVFETAIEYLSDYPDVQLFTAFAKFETRLHEFDRARIIYKFALDKFPKSSAPGLFDEYTRFEKQFASKEDIDRVLYEKRQLEYEDELLKNPDDLNTWFEYLRLEESYGDAAAIRNLYERAIAQVPPADEKRLWRRYIYLWIRYALFEEVDAQDFERTRAVYLAALSLVPHQRFTFAKLWLLYAKFEIRRGNLSAARKALGKAIGVAPKPRLFKGYIDIEMELREFSRCRILFEKYLEHFPTLTSAWIRFAEMERALGEEERARVLCDFALAQEAGLDAPEQLWRSYIAAEAEDGEYDRARALYERLLQAGGRHSLRVWLSYAEMEVSFAQELADAEPAESAECLARARALYKRADRALAEEVQALQAMDPDLPESDPALSGLVDTRVVLYTSWRRFEAQWGDAESRQRLNAWLPRRHKKRRRVEAAETDGSALYEEYYSYVFPLDAEVAAEEALRSGAASRQASDARLLQLANLLGDDDSDDEDDDLPLEDLGALLGHGGPAAATAGSPGADSPDDDAPGTGRASSEEADAGSPAASSSANASGDDGSA
ncbi:hypothetical protein H696_05163 [Fonticula alba]|uniref:Suppressor of forked domain-containing protein n=1 Tax=Fonticula alba TaxID=691883 RepID=A0A058Z1S9_FONAL|nr:hypothetical protein H696_05163 [Fonticula alba]KCV68239.1 hypothetical protein H696_05163 [Fonticula alba]|eukprot:XP_009497293.1 hypothetical protein H696_05163 [Fonticula alba]